MTTGPLRFRRRDPATAMLFGGLGHALVLAAAISVPAVMFGTRHAAGALIGAVLALPALAVVPGLMRISRRWSPVAAMGAAIGTYSLVMSALWLVSVQVGAWSAVSGEGLAAGFGGAVLGWSVGVMRAVRRARQTVWDEPV